MQFEVPFGVLLEVLMTARAHFLEVLVYNCRHAFRYLGSMLVKVFSQAIVALVATRNKYFPWSFRQSGRKMRRVLRDVLSMLAPGKRG